MFGGAGAGAGVVKVVDGGGDDDDDVYGGGRSDSVVKMAVLLLVVVTLQAWNEAGGSPWSRPVRCSLTASDADTSGSGNGHTASRPSAKARQSPRLSSSSTGGRGDRDGGVLSKLWSTLGNLLAQVGSKLVYGVTVVMVGMRLLRSPAAAGTVPAASPSSIGSDSPRHVMEPTRSGGTSPKITALPHSTSVRQLRVSCMSCVSVCILVCGCVCVCGCGLACGFVCGFGVWVCACGLACGLV